MCVALLLWLRLVVIVLASSWLPLSARELPALTWVCLLSCVRAMCLRCMVGGLWDAGCLLGCSPRLLVYRVACGLLLRGCGIVVVVDGGPWRVNLRPVWRADCLVRWPGFRLAQEVFWHLFQEGA